MKPYDIIEAAALLVLMPFVAALVVAAAMACIVAAPVLIFCGAIGCIVEFLTEGLRRA